ncbi:MAG: Blue-light-activated protein [Acidobacteria bacterium]|nr:Blue-light-activated protein [Acidobacteriota bacterium]
MACALVLTHRFWLLVQHTPFLLSFGAVVLSSRLGGRRAGLLAVFVGAVGHTLFPPPIPEGGFGILLAGFVIISATCSWLVARQYEVETDLRASQARLTDAQQIAHIGSWEWNVADHTGSCSLELYEICGISPGSFTPTVAAFMALLPIDEQEKVSNIVQKALIDHRPFQFEHHIVRPDGIRRVMNSRGRVIVGDNGEVVRMVGAAQDITEQKAAEEVISRSERRLKTIIDAEPACVKLVSPDGLLLDMNQAGLEMIGADNLGQIVGRPVIALIHPDDRDQYQDMHRAATAGCPGRLEFRIVGLDGQERWVDSRAVPFETASGYQLQRAVLSVTSDITERVRTQRTLHDTEERMRFALESSRLGVWQTNIETGVSYWSHTCEVLHGLERGTFGKSLDSFIDCVHPADQEAVRREIDAAVREHRDAELAYRTVWPDHTEHQILSRGHFFYDDAGVPLRGDGISIDITERRSLEAQLRQSQKMEAIGLLAGGIAHDFNNLLTAIGGYTELVLRTFAGEDTRRDDLLEVVKAAQRAAALTRQLLAVSRRQILETTALDVNAMVADVQKLLRRTIPENIDLQLELSSTLESVRADRGQLEQVVLNLAVNAGDAMPKGGQLRLATACVDVDEPWARRHPPMKAGRYVRLTVRDTGIGMTEETQAHMFEPFFTTKECGRGTGLGLATVYGIVKQSHGFIWVDSKIEGGTTFEIYLPVVQGPVDAPDRVDPTVIVEGGSQTILLAEDDGAVRRLGRDILVNQGYTVLGARDGDEALLIARRYPNTIHLLIADVVMPGLSGRDVALRLVRDRPGLRVLYTSGYTENVMMRAGFESGLALLPKPFLPGDLLRKVKEILGTAD